MMIARRVLFTDDSSGISRASAAVWASSCTGAGRRAARDPATALLTVEGEKDDICAVGQTHAAQDCAAAYART